MVDTMPAGGATVVPIEEGSMDATSSAASAAAMAATGVSAAAASVAAAAAAESEAAKNAPSHQQQSNASAAGGAGQQTNANGAPLRQVARPNLKPSWTQTPRILVVEDDVVYRQLSSKFLEKFGCVVETAENAQQGVEKMNQTKYDLVLMDISFGPTDISFEPSMDGRKATSLIRQFDIYTPIISMTSNVQTSECKASNALLTIPRRCRLVSAVGNE
jgi:osomolarity two-component system response regulator SKN7